MLARGYAATGINEVLATAGVPKGSFYHHFPSKEAFAIEVVERYFATHDTRELARALDDHQHPPLDRLRRYFEAATARFAQATRGGCLVGNVAQELAGSSEPVRTEVAEVFDRWRSRFADCLRAAQDAGQLAPGADADALAGFLLNSWEGAILQMKVTQDPAPLRTFLTVVFDRVLTR